jgi:hypothetical protein
MNNSDFLQPTEIWLVGRRVHDRLCELTNLTEQEGYSNDCSCCADQASTLTEYLTTHDIRLFFKWDTLMDTFNELYPTNSAGVPVLVVDADMLGDRRLRLLHTYQQENPHLVVVLYMATGHSLLAMQMDKLDFSGFITRQDTDHQWINVFDALGQKEFYCSPGWTSLLREGGLLFAGDNSVIYPLADWIGQASQTAQNQITGQKVGFLTD